MREERRPQKPADVQVMAVKFPAPAAVAAATATLGVGRCGSERSVEPAKGAWAADRCGGDRRLGFGKIVVHLHAEGGLGHPHHLDVVTGLPGDAAGGGAAAEAAGAAPTATAATTTAETGRTRTREHRTGDLAIGEDIRVGGAAITTPAATAAREIRTIVRLVDE